MHSAAQAYGTVAKQIANPRELEAQLLLKAAARLQTVKDGGTGAQDLDEALHYNRKLWTVLLSSVTSGDSHLPAAIRQNVANLGIFVMNQTLALVHEPAPERLSSLIRINRELAAGLLGR